MTSQALHLPRAVTSADRFFLTLSQTLLARVARRHTCAFVAERRREQIRADLRAARTAAHHSGFMPR